MRERPILFSGSMVRAIFEGRKTQTRRVIKRPEQWMIEDYAPGVAMAEDGNGDSYDVSTRCPYGRPGDTLWVRETHFVLKAGYKDGTDRDIVYRADDPDWPYGWIPSIHMPRGASRITLRITNVRVERVQDISVKDAKAEGWNVDTVLFPLVNTRDKAVSWFRNLWNSINAKRGYSWESNPWVWVIEFEPIMANIDEVMK